MSLASFTLTIRDNSVETINCTIEGSVAKILSAFDRLHIGDVVQVQGAKILTKSINKKQHSDYLPGTSSLCHLIGDLDNEQFKISTIDINSKGNLIWNPSEVIFFT